MIPQEVALVEYQALRQEINTGWERRSSRMSLVWATISALIAASALAELPELSILAFILTNAGWADELRWFDNMVRISSYISAILEPQIEGLQWETIQKKIKHSNQRYYWFSSLKSTYGLFALSSLSASIFLYVISFPTELFRHFIFWIFVFFGVLFSRNNIKTAYDRQNRWRYWERKFKHVASQYQLTISSPKIDEGSSVE